MSQCLQKKLSMTLKLDGVPRYSTAVLLYTVGLLPTSADSTISKKYSCAQTKVEAVKLTLTLSTLILNEQESRLLI